MCQVWFFIFAHRMAKNIKKCLPKVKQMKKIQKKKVYFSTPNIFDREREKM